MCQWIDIYVEDNVSGVVEDNVSEWSSISVEDNVSEWSEISVEDNVSEWSDISVEDNVSVEQERNICGG